jgi:hypothetical protein
VITRQGGNEFHGEVIGYYSGSALTGKERDVLYQDPYDIYNVSYVNNQDLYGKEKVDRTEVGFSLGGYILKDRLWFFGSVLGSRVTIRKNTSITTSRPSSRLNPFVSFAWA